MPLAFQNISRTCYKVLQPSFKDFRTVDDILTKMTYQYTQRFEQEKKNLEFRAHKMGHKQAFIEFWNKFNNFRPFLRNCGNDEELMEDLRDKINPTCPNDICAMDFNGRI